MNNIPQKTEQALQDLLLKAFEAQQSGDNRQAENLYRHLIVLIPEFWQLYYNLGLLLFEEDRCEEALEVYEKAVSLPNSDNDLLFNFAICQKKLGLYEEAVTTYEQALALDADDTESHYNRAGCLMALERFADALSAYQTVISLAPEHLPALNNQAYLCQRMGKIDLAVECYTRLLELEPNHHSADHMLAALKGSARSSAPESYIREVFDQFSDHYEKNLVDKLQYRLPERLLTIVMQDDQKVSFSSLLDLGCGTGLLGVHFRPIVDKMHGIDLSCKMIEKAELKGIYDRLYNEDINTFLSLGKPDSYDLLIAADVFTYVGELEETFTNCYHASSRNALFCFSVEDLPHPSSLLRLQKSGRFAHSHQYIERTAVKAGWHIYYSEQLDLRREGNSWIQGRLYKMTKKDIT